MADASNLRAYYPGKYLTADNDALTEQTADAGGSTTTIVDAALTQADDYWNGAVLFFEPDTTTAALRGQYAHVEDFDAASDTLTLYKELPAAPVAGDTYRLVLGGKWRSSYQIPSLTASAPSNVTGVTIDHAAYENGTGNGTLTYTFSGQTLKWTAPSGTIGPAVAVGGSGTFQLFDDDASKWIEVTVVGGSLPGSDKSDTIALTQPVGKLIPDAEGAETTAGKTRYYAVPVKNTHGADTIYGVSAYLAKEVSTAADTTTTTTLPDGGGAYPATLGLTSAANWPASGWVYNVDRNDFRYYYNKSGNSLRCLDPGSGLRGKTSVAWGIGDDVQLAPDIDIGAGAPDGSSQFEDPANETTAPSGVTFSCPITAAAGVSLGDMAAAEVEVVWAREVIVAGARSKASALSQVRFQLDV